MWGVERQEGTIHLCGWMLSRNVYKWWVEFADAFIREAPVSSWEGKRSCEQSTRGNSERPVRLNGSQGSGATGRAAPRWWAWTTLTCSPCFFFLPLLFGGPSSDSSFVLIWASKKKKVCLIKSLSFLPSLKEMEKNRMLFCGRGRAGNAWSGLTPTILLTVQK